MSDDPESQRIAHLVAREGDLSDAERAELDLYTDDRPELVSEIRAQVTAAQAVAPRVDDDADRDWLVRTEADRKIQRVESSPFVRAERAIGVALAVGGVAVSLVAPVAGTIAFVGGTGVLFWSLIRVRMQTIRDDPYKDVKQ